MSRVMLILGIFIFTGCNRNPDIGDDFPYDNPNNYWTRLKVYKIPDSYNLEEKLLLISHGFDSNVKITLSQRLWNELKKKQEEMLILNYLKSPRPELAWSAAFVIEKCGDFNKYEQQILEVYKRKDVIEFERMYIL